MVKIMVSKFPRCPRWLTGLAQAEWKRVIPWLVERGIYDELFQTLLAAYCQSYARWIELVNSLKSGLTYRDYRGREKWRPELGLARRKYSLMAGLCGDFCQLQDSTGRMLIPGSPPDEHEELQRLLAARFRAKPKERLPDSI